VTNAITALVTGAGSGIGAAVVRGLLEQDPHARIACIDIRFATEPPPTANERFHPIVADLRHSDALRNSVAEAVAWLGADVSTLIQCAGVYRVTPLLECDEHTWDDIFAVNARAMFLVAQAVVRLRPSTAVPLSIVNVSSTAAVRGLRTEPAAAYNASKAAVLAMTRQMAVEWAARGVRANVVLPGFTDTPMVRILNDPTEGQVILNGLVPLRRVASAEEIARTIRFLASEASSYTTGAEVVVDGGLLLAAGEAKND